MCAWNDGKYRMRMHLNPRCRRLHCRCLRRRRVRRDVRVRALPTMYIIYKYWFAVLPAQQLDLASYPSNFFKFKNLLSTCRSIRVRASRSV